MLVARDAQSFHRMQSTFDNPVIFTPDMVLYMKPVNWNFNRNGALFVLRHDSEKVVKKSTIDNINPDYSCTKFLTTAKSVKYNKLP